MFLLISLRSYIIMKNSLKLRGSLVNALAFAMKFPLTQGFRDAVCFVFTTPDVMHRQVHHHHNKSQ
jgi:hypothetical protein